MAPAIVDLTSDARQPAKNGDHDTSTVKYPDLHAALDDVTLPRLVHVVKSICHDSESTARLFENRLFTSAQSSSAPLANHKKRSVSNDLDTTSPSGNDVKRTKRARYVKCVRCRSDFDTQDNHKGDCEWHPGTEATQMSPLPGAPSPTPIIILYLTTPIPPGDQELDDEANCWAEHRENFYEHDYKDYAPSCAEGFPWTCCDRPADAPPCKAGRHRAEENAVEWGGLLYAIDEFEDEDESTEESSDEEDYEDYEDDG
jgi:hypothetical protein